MVLISRLISWVGIVVAWVGVWLVASPAAALVIIGASLLMVGAPLVAGLRRRGANKDAEPKDPQRAYDGLQAAYRWNRLAVPIVCLVILIYVEPSLGRSLVIGGVLTNVFAAIPADQRILAELREQGAR